MSSPEQEPQDDKPEEDGQQVENLADKLTPAYREHVEEFLSIMPQLGDVRAYVPVGTIVQVEEWIFPVLDWCKENGGGCTVMRIGDANELGWARCFGAGMPQDIPPINLYFHADIYHEKYKDFAIHAQGVLADPENPEKGKSAWRWVYTHPVTGKEFTLHLWTQMVYLRNSTTQMVAHYNSGTDPFYSSITQMGKGIRIDMADLNPSDLASSHLLVDSTVLFTDHQRILDAALAQADDTRSSPRPADINREGVKNLIRNIAKSLHLERLERPSSMLAPVPIHFPQYSKLDKPWVAQDGEFAGLEMEALYKHYGFPRGLRHMVVTYQGENYSSEFADFTIELFGLKGNPDEPETVIRLEERAIRDNVTVANVDPESLPYGSGGTFSLINPETGKCDVKIHVWRWRIFMNNSSLCLELNWHRNDFTHGGWIPYMLGIKYDDDPEKAVEEGIRFAPAYRLCNLIKADLSQKRGGHLIKDIEKWTQRTIEDMAQESKRKGKIIPYSFTWFSRVFPYQTSRTNLYTTLLTPREIEGLAGRYIELCNKLMIEDGKSDCQ